jgi:hypothetical protein
MKLNVRSSPGLGWYRQCLRAAGDGGVRLDPATLLEVLFQLGEGDLVFRGGGMSLFRRIRFDHFRAKNGMRHDRISGVSLQTELIRQVVLVPEGISPMRIEVEFCDTGNSLTFYPAVLAAQSARMQVLENAVESSECTIAHPEDWLGDGICGAEQSWNNRMSLQKSRFHSGVCMQVQMQSQSCAMEFGFHATWIDLEGPLHRLSEPEGKAVVHFDATYAQLHAEGLHLLSPLIETCFR